MYIPSIATTDLGHTYYIFVHIFQAVLVLNENGLYLWMQQLTIWQSR